MTSELIDVTKEIAKRFTNEQVNPYTDKSELKALIKEINSFDLGDKVHHSIIAGEEYKGDEIFEAINPNKPAQVIGRFSRFGTKPKAIEYLLYRANQASKQFYRLPLSKRADALRSIAQVLRERKRKLDAALILSGKNPLEADADTCEGIDFPEYYALELEVLLGDHLTPSKDTYRKLVHKPWGSVVCANPFNFAVAIESGQDNLSLAGANSAISKPSLHTPHCGLLVYQVAQEGLRRAGIQIPGLVNLIIGGAQEMQALLKSDNIKGYCYTGSLKGALEIKQIVLSPNGPGYRVQPIASEHNGVNAIIILNDADPQSAVEASTISLIGNSGQKCSKDSWIIAEEAIYSQVRDGLVSRLAKVKVGPVIPTLEGYNDYGALISKQALEKALMQIEEFKQKGAQVIFGENPLIDHPDKGYLMKPVLLEVSPQVLYQHPELRDIEIFAPVAAIVKAKNLEEAIIFEKMSHFALTGGIFTNSKEAINSWLGQSDVGNKYINRKITGALVGQTFGTNASSWSGLGGIKGAGGPYTVLRAVRQESLVGYLRI